MRQLSAVESRLARCHHEHARIARSPAELDQVRSAGKLALVHCVEGGLSLGARPESIERAVKLLASQGVAYVTIAHLFWRRVATNVPSLPFMSDNVYKWGFPQPT